MIQKLGKYDVRGLLGRGAMGVVYEGYDPLIKRSVALKVIRSDQLQGDAAEGVLARFRREAEAAGRLNHPNIVAIYDFAEDGGTWYIAMELVKGRELKEAFEGNERFRMPDVVGRLRNYSMTPAGMSPVETAAFLKQETERWREVIVAADIKPE